MVAIVPRSFCNGPYFKPFREQFFSMMSLRHIHVFEKRDRAFKDDAVLQENIIIHAVKDNRPGDITITTLLGRLSTWPVLKHFSRSYSSTAPPPRPDAQTASPFRSCLRTAAGSSWNNTRAEWPTSAAGTAAPSCDQDPAREQSLGSMPPPPRHLRTTNIVESPFASVRLRTNAAKRYKKVVAASALIWRTLMVAEKRFRRLNAPHLLHVVYAQHNQTMTTIDSGKKLAA